MVQRGTRAHLFEAEKQKDNEVVLRFGRKRVNNFVTPDSVSHKILPSSSTYSRPPRPATVHSTTTTTSSSRPPYYNAESSASTFDLKKGKKHLSTSTATTANNSTIRSSSSSSGFMEGFSSHEQKFRGRGGMYREQDIAAMRASQEKERAEIKRQFQTQIRRESAALCAEDNRIYTEQVSSHPHIMAPKREYRRPTTAPESNSQRLDPASDPTNKAINQYYKSRPVWKFKDKDFGTYKII